MNSGPVSFPDWKNILNASALAPQSKAAFLREILAFLKYCKAARAPATNEVARQYLAWRETQTAGPAREALRWFYREGRRPGSTQVAGVGDRPPSPPPPAGPMVPPPPVSAPPLPRPVVRSAEPPPAASDLGTVPWERDLIREVRERHFLWRTEQTYREWAVRFARFIAPRSPYAAGGEDVAAFLSALAVNGRASPSAQKQALNALVFLMHEALHRD